MTSSRLVWLDEHGDKIFDLDGFDANGFPLRKSYVTDFEHGVRLFVDTRGTRTEISPQVLVIDKRRPPTSPSTSARPAARAFGNIKVQVSDGTTLAAVDRTPARRRRCASSATPRTR